MNHQQAQFQRFIGPKTLVNQLRRTPIELQRGPRIFGQEFEYSDLHRVIKIDRTLILFSETEYRLFSMLIRAFSLEQRGLLYTEIAREIYDCPFDEELLLPIRRRISAIRKKLRGQTIDIVCVPQRGYELRSLNESLWNYRRGYRASTS
jgi:DNA-binding response OmpR family regulator